MTPSVYPPTEPGADRKLARLDTPTEEHCDALRRTELEIRQAHDYAEAIIKAVPPELPAIVIILSASSEEADIATAYRLGANGYLVKPSDICKLEDIAKSIKDFWLTQNTSPPESRENVAAILPHRPRQETLGGPTTIADPMTTGRSVRPFDRLQSAPGFITSPRTDTATARCRPKPPVPACPPPNGAPAPDRTARVRRVVFRCVRLLLAAGLLAAAAFYAKLALTNVASDQAYVSAEIISVRAPIAGQLSFESVSPGAIVSAGTMLFRVENPRFGNQEAMAQLNWIKELVERLQVEADEAIVRHKQQEQIFPHHEALFKEQLISRLAYLEEASKVALALSCMTNKQAQLQQALTRSREVERQVALQKDAAVMMPVDGIIWNVPQQNGGLVPPGETVMQIIDPQRIWVDAQFAEKFADKLQVGTLVAIRTRDGTQSWSGRVESIRGGAGRVSQEGIATAGFGEFARRRVAVRVKVESANPFDAAQFYGVGRSVVVSLNAHE